MEKLVLNGLLMVGSILIVIPKSVESRPSGPMELQSHYVQAIAAYRRLERILPKEELRAVTSLGLLNGARQAEEQMEQHLVKAIRDLLLQMNLTESGSVMMGKIDAIEEQLSRDQRALEILTRVMDVVSQAKDDHEFRAELRQMAQQQKEDELHSQQLSADLTDQPKLGQRLGQLRSHIIRQVPQLKNELEAKIELALQHLLQQAAEDGLLGRAKQKVLHKRQIKKGVDQRKPQQQEQQKQQEQEQQEQDEAEERQMPEEMRIIKSILSEDDFQENMLEQQPARRLKMEPPTSELDDLEINVKAPNVTAKAKGKPRTSAKPEKQVEAQAEGTGSSELATDDSDDLGDGDLGAGDEGGGGGGGGGLVGLIGSLSGGEGGSDVGALIGALTGLVSTLFGPGGLDVQGLIQTGSSLISGLLGGNKNFGLVLGQYVGTALDGLSGGGGAINNGQFVGNFLGTVLAALSADPEEEGPPQPLTFTKNLITSFLEAKFRPNSEEGSEERHGSAELPRPRKKKEGGGGWAAAAASSFDSGGFVKHLASHLVSNALGLILNAGLGAAGGASSAAKNIFASSSMGHHAKPAEHHHRSGHAYYDNEPF
ncbi:golgin subfamily A member 6-like protein 2 isoform X2 [Drosophila gunungcola]|uniref:golgin subfamily A member 6-like protein 2 isoform X2 n=1 Tax=Drosophila gunungcola TaxID=103775 RepID=UPI0022E7614E|nr:golgin subfamily A member 6-like protein 2 isoform X2 [Drosophila gunungcola]